jgi:hypothetical protein
VGCSAAAAAGAAGRGRTAGRWAERHTHTRGLESQTRTVDGVTNQHMLLHLPAHDIACWSKSWGPSCGARGQLLGPLGAL